MYHLQFQCKFRNSENKTYQNTSIVSKTLIKAQDLICGLEPSIMPTGNYYDLNVLIFCSLKILPQNIDIVTMIRKYCMLSGNSIETKHIFLLSISTHQGYYLKFCSLYLTMSIRKDTEKNF